MSNLEAGGSLMMMPDDVIADTLSRLEVKSVLRCRCVCKSWKMITQQKIFIEKHQKRSQIVHQYDNQYRSNGEIYMFQGCCNGIVLEVKANSNEYRIRNPATKQVLQLEKDKSVISTICKPILGFDSSTGNFKIINLCRNKGGGADIGVIMVTIGSDDLSYESLDITLLGEGRGNPCIVCHNDVCYALSYCFNDLEKSDLIRFTLDGKNSMNILLPRDFQTGLFPGGNGSYINQCRQFHRQFQMFIIEDDKLTIGFYYRQELHVWVLENYNKHMWSKKMIIPLDFMKAFPNSWTIIVSTSPKYWSTMCSPQKVYMYSQSTSTRMLPFSSLSNISERHAF